MQAKEAIIAITGQITGLLDQFTPYDYRKPLDEYDGSSIGQHFRHILEFFQCLQQGISDGQVDYAARKRNLLYEDNPALAAEAFSAFLEQIEAYSDTLPLSVCAEFGSEVRPVYSSTVGRELLFIYDHAIHHLAIIKIGLNCQFPHISTDRHLGVSPSTIKSRQTAS
ncbi:MAG: DinB family protein [Bacteroidota bacterium]|jgi:uncharacterized damage-inducible protein DinB